MKKHRTITAVIVAAASLAVFAAFAVYSAKEIRSMDVEEIDLSRVPDGVYKGEQDYFGFTCRVEVTVKDHRMVDVKVYEDRESEYVEKAKDVAQNVLREQSLKVDTVTGATVTSKAILKAIENALPVEE